MIEKYLNPTDLALDLITPRSVIHESDRMEQEECRANPNPNPIIPYPSHTTQVLQQPIVAAVDKFDQGMTVGKLTSVNGAMGHADVKATLKLQAAAGIMISEGAAAFLEGNIIYFPTHQANSMHGKSSPLHVDSANGIMWAHLSTDRKLRANTRVDGAMLHGNKAVCYPLAAVREKLRTLDDNGN